MQLGMDSLAALELKNNIQGYFGMEMPATIIFDHPTALSLAKYILDKMLSVQNEKSRDASSGLSLEQVTITRTQIRIKTTLESL